MTGTTPADPDSLLSPSLAIPTESTYPAAVLAKLIAGREPADYHLEELPQPWGELAGAVLACPPGGQRSTALDIALLKLPSAEASTIRAAIFAADPAAELPKITTYKTAWTMAELYTTDFPEPKWAVPGIIPVGLSFLAGRPKLGKSWLALQIAQAVGTGGRALGEKVEKGKVLYLALEDSPRRLKERATKQRIPAGAAIEFRTVWKPLAEGGLMELQTEIGRGGYSLVIIDTLSRALGKADQLDPAEMTGIIGNLQYLAIQNDIAILLIDHHRKSNGFESSPIDDILGSTAKAAVADAALGLYREQGKHGATLKVTGRDLEEKELALEWDALMCCWQSLGDAGQVRKDSKKSEILDAIRILTEDGQPATTARIAAHTGIDKANVSHMLADLCQAGKIKKGNKTGKEQPYEAI